MVSVPLTDAYPRDIFRGLMQFAHEQQRYAIRFHDQHRYGLNELQEFSRSKSAVGLVIFGADRDLIRGAQELQLPTVNVSTWFENTPFPSVLVNNEAVGDKAAAYLWRKGYRSHAFIHLDGVAFSQRRKDGWRAYLRERGCEGASISFDQFPNVMQQLEQMERPLAITAATDHLARSILDRCLNVGWSIPDEVSVIGCANDELVCEGGLITLSSVPIQGRQVGMMAGQILTDIIDGNPAPVCPVYIEPGEVVERESTDLISQAEPSISNAIRFIRAQACNGIQIPDVLSATGLSRATLDRQVKRILGHSPHDEIKRIQLERARHLLTHTHLPLAEISVKCGFKEPNYFMRVFREDTGRTPTEYRRDLLSKVATP